MTPPPSLAKYLGTGTDRNDRRRDNWKELFNLRVDILAALAPQGQPLYFPAWGWGDYLPPVMAPPQCSIPLASMIALEINCSQLRTDL